MTVTATYRDNIFTKTSTRKYEYVIIGRITPDDVWKDYSWSTSARLAKARVNGIKRLIGSDDVLVIQVDKI